MKEIRTAAVGRRVAEKAAREPSRVGGNMKTATMTVMGLPG